MTEISDTKELMLAKVEGLQGEIKALRLALHTEVEALRILKEHDLHSLHNEIEALRTLKEQDHSSLTGRFTDSLIAMNLRFDDNLSAANLRFEDSKINLISALGTVDESNKLAAAAIEKRFESVNEFRRTLSDQTATFITRTEISLTIDNLIRELESIKINVSRLATIAESNEKTGAIAGTQLEQRLHEINEFRTQLKDQTQTFITRNEFNAMTLPLDEKIEKISRPNFTLFLGLGSMIIVLIGGAWAVIGLQIQVANAPIVSAVAQMQVEIAQLKGVAQLKVQPPNGPP